jgi:Leucine-rich repeat (LRR) protein
MNTITDLAPLSGLTNLVTLYINNNQISDFSPITGQTKFKEIYAARNAVLTKETYLAHIPAIRANNLNLTVFQYDPGCKAVMSTDVNGDCRVNLSDLAMLAADWLKCNHIYEEMCL